MNVEYPVLPDRDGDFTEEDKENVIARYYGHQNRSGFFPIGSHNTWHGGIHIEDFGTYVRAIADGRIIAYRIAEDYIPEKNSETNKYSNSFMLIQHNFETPEKVKLNFYSLYMHLQPKKEMETSSNGENIPDLYAKYTTKTKVGGKETGIKVREYRIGDTKKSKETVFVPKGGLLKKDTTTKAPEGHWMQNNKKYVFCSYNGETLCALKSWLIDYDKDNYKVNHLRARDKNTIDSNAKSGTMLFNGINGTYVSMKNKGVELEIEKTKNSKWYKIKDTNYFVLAKDCTEVSKKIKDDVKFNSIENVDVPVKAGQIIGVPSKYESDALQNYTTVHLEVFTDDKNLSSFINNNKDKDRISYEVEIGKVLQVAQPCNFLKANTKVKIYQIKDSYAQIGFEDVFCEAKNVTDIKHKGKQKIFVNGKRKKKTVYVIKEDKFSEINTKLHNLLPNKETYVYWAKKLSKSLRKIGYGTQRSGEKYWVNANEISGAKNQWVTLSSDITSVYEVEPNSNTKNKTVSNTAKVRKLASVTDSNGNEWYKVKTKEIQGWIKKSELTEKNPFNWSDYGWEIKENTGNQYLYMFGELVENTEPHDFIKQVWKHIDTDGDKQISNHELKQAVRNKDKLEYISKLICKHPNEWNTWANIGKYENEVKQLYKKGIDQEEDSTKKQELEKQRDQKIEKLKAKIEKLCFWDQIQKGDIVPLETRKNEYIEKNKSYHAKRTLFDQTPEEIELGKEFDKLAAETTPRYFPTNDNVYHFHPIAFVEHMKMILERRAPWMEIAIEESKKAKGCVESKEPMYSMAESYLRFVGNQNKPTDGEKGPWCASFMNWCMSKSGYKYAKSSSSLCTLHNDYKHNFKKIETPIYGCIVVYKHTSKWKGHIGFLYGKDSNEKYLLLGGNQSNTIKLSRYGDFTSSKQTKKLVGFYVPVDYEITSSDYLTEKDLNLNLAEENKKIGVLNSKETGQTT